MTSQPRMWLGDAYVFVGTSIGLCADGDPSVSRGTATITDIRPIKEIAEGTLLIDPRTLCLVKAAGPESYTRPTNQWLIDYLGGSGADGLCMADELFPIITITPVQPATADTDSVVNES